MNLKTGETHLLSTGKGKTTCAWYHPNQKKALFSSTHQDPQFKAKVEAEYKERANPVQGKYSWSFDEYFDIFEVDLNTKKLKALTKEKGYDAEASYSPDGKWILFASNRSGYQEKLSEEEQKLFEKDPSSQMELYLMKADGTGLKRLTHHLGYDGGPFFSADGKKITWRRFNKMGTFAEIWVMNADGSDARQLTNWQAMSWAPYFHPSGDYLIFTSNKLGYQNFELFIVDTLGKNQPVRVSFQDGFDGLPVFSPDGNSLIWSHRNNSGESQLLWAQWDDLKARELLGLETKFPEGKLAKSELSESDLKRMVYHIAGPQFKGRMTGSQEEQTLSVQVANWFEAVGLTPYFRTGFLQPFEFVSKVELGKSNELILKSGSTEAQKYTRALKVGQDFLPYGFSARGQFNFSKVSFAGYGLVVPPSDKQAGYDSYQDIDVKGKWVLVFRDIPQDIPNDRRIYFNQFSRLHHKALVAKQKGAIGLLVAKGPHSPSKKELGDLRLDGAGAEATLPLISISDEFANQIVADSKVNLGEWQKLLDKGEMRAASELASVEVSAVVDLVDQKSKGTNVVAMLPQKGAKKTLVIGAHGDHLGTGQAGSSLASGSLVGQPHWGADDNASGMALVMALAKELADYKAKGVNLPFNVAFAIWSGEEIGLLGSHDFLKKNHPAPIMAYFNFDMVGRLRDNLVIQGVASAKEWKSWLEPYLVTAPFSIQLQDDPYVPTDGMAFYLKNIPILSFFTGAHAEYHTPLDTPNTLNYKGIHQIKTLSRDMLIKLAQSSEKKPKTTLLTYQKVEGASQNPNRRFRVFLGTIPDYVQEKVKGVKISGTSKDSPAEKAGLKAGDVIISVDQVSIDNLYDYVYVLQALKPKQPVQLKFVRQGKSYEVSVTPQLRE
jgi:dipeptidyl aminopeptidase/acylaminoacyl peptidase